MLPVAMESDLVCVLCIYSYTNRIDIIILKQKMCTQSPHSQRKHSSTRWAPLVCETGRREVNSYVQYSAADCILPFLRNES